VSYARVELPGGLGVATVKRLAKGIDAGDEGYVSHGCTKCGSSSMSNDVED
jgi:hypothetical protein